MKHLCKLLCARCAQLGEMENKGLALGSSFSSICLPFYQLMRHVTIAPTLSAAWSRWAYKDREGQPVPNFFSDLRWKNASIVCNSNKQNRNNIQANKRWAVRPFVQVKSSKTRRQTHRDPTAFVHPSDITSSNVLYFSLNFLFWDNCWFACSCKKNTERSLYDLPSLPQLGNILWDNSIISQRGYWYDVTHQHGSCFETQPFEKGASP